MNIAIVIVNWNAGDYLHLAVASALQQSRPAERIVVVDNASTDHSLESLVQFGDAVEIHRMPGNLGFAEANNRIIKELEGIDWVALLNPDAKADPCWLQALEQGVRQYPQARAFASRMMSMDVPGVLDGAGDEYHLSGLVWRRFHGQALDSVDAMCDIQVFAPCGGAAFYHRDSFHRAGGFDKRYFCYCEDSDLAFRMQLKDMPCWYLHRAVVFHKGGATTGEDNRFSDYHGHRNLVWSWLKNMPLPMLIGLFPLHIVMNLLVIVLKLPSGRAGVIASAKLDAVKGIKPILAERQTVQNERRISLFQLWRIMSKSPARKRAGKFG